MITGDQLQRELTGTARTLAEAKGIAVKFAGNQACTNGKFIQLPAVELQREFSPEEVSVLRGYVDHEAAHVTDTELALMEHVVTAHGKNTGVLMNAIEDMRIERKAIERLPRVKHNLDAVGSFLNAHIPAEYVPTLRADAATAITWQGRADQGYAISGDELVNRMDASEREVIQRYASRLNALTSTRDSLALALDMMGDLTPEETPADPPQGDSGQGDGDESAPESGDESAPESDDESDTQSDAPDGDMNDDESDDESGTGAGESQSGDESDADDDWNDDDDDADDDWNDDDADDESESDCESGAPQESESGDESEGESGTGDESDELTDDDELTDKGDDESGEGGYGAGTGEQDQNELDLKSADLGDAIEELLAQPEAPELDELGRVDETLINASTADSNLDAVVPIEESVPGAYTPYANQMLDDMEGHLNAVSQRLARLLLAFRPRRWEGGHRSGRLNARRLSQIPTHATDRVWSKRKPSAAMDTAVMLVVDCSASMKARVNGGSTQRIEIAARAALAMTIGLQRAGVSTKVVGFNTAYQTPAQRDAYADTGGYDDYALGTRLSPHTTHVVMDWRNKRVQRTADSIQNFNRLAHAAASANSDGDAIMWARAELARRPEQRKVLIVLSDGQPAGGRMYGEGEFLKRAVKDTLAAGIECVGIGIASTDVAEYYPHHVVIEKHISELPDILMGELGDLLKPKANQR